MFLQNVQCLRYGTLRYVTRGWKTGITLGPGLGLAFSGLGLDLGLELCGLVNNAARPLGS